MNSDNSKLPMDPSKSRVVGKAKTQGHEPAVFIETKTERGLSLELWLSDVFKGSRRWHLWSAIPLEKDDAERLKEIEEEMLKKAWKDYAGGALMA